jgi:GTP-binding protein Era
LTGPVPLPGSEQEARSPATFRCGYVAIIGKPNVGKSTLMNALIGQKISIVTPKPQTTRHRILGIRTRELDQIIFLDTPGLMKPEYPLHDAMMEAARSAISDADVAVLMIDAMSPGSGEEIDMEPAYALLRGCRAPVYLVINKMDLVKPERILPVIASYAEKQMFKEIYPVSALKQIGTEDLLNGLSAELPVHPPYYPAEIVSEHSERFFVAELIREKIFEKFRDEIPYSTAVQIADFKEIEGRKDLIQAEIIVERDSQKGIMIGKDGTALKEVGELARKEIEAFLQRPVYLELYVKVKEQWRKKDEWLKRFGYR